MSARWERELDPLEAPGYTNLKDAVLTAWLPAWLQAGGDHVRKHAQDNARRSLAAHMEALRRAVRGIKAAADVLEPTWKESKHREQVPGLQADKANEPANKAKGIRARLLLPGVEWKVHLQDLVSAVEKLNGTDLVGRLPRANTRPGRTGNPPAKARATTQVSLQAYVRHVSGHQPSAMELAIAAIAWGVDEPCASPAEFNTACGRWRTFLKGRRDREGSGAAALSKLERARAEVARLERELKAVRERKA